MRILHRCAEVNDMGARIACYDENQRRRDWLLWGGRVCIALVLVSVLLHMNGLMPAWLYFTIIGLTFVYNAVHLVALHQGRVK